MPRGLPINRLLVGESGTDIEKLSIERDNFTVFNRQDLENQLVLDDSKFAQPLENVNDGYFAFDPTEFGNGDSILETAGVNDLRVIPNFKAAPGTFPVLVEYVGPVGA